MTSRVLSRAQQVLVLFAWTLLVALPVRPFGVDALQLDA
jgi:hypothetical protein